MNEIQVLNARSGDCPGLPSGLSGSQPWKTSSSMPQKNQKRLTISSAFEKLFPVHLLRGVDTAHAVDEPFDRSHEVEPRALTSVYFGNVASQRIAKHHQSHPLQDNA